MNDKERAFQPQLRQKTKQQIYDEIQLMTPTEKTTFLLLLFNEFDSTILAILLVAYADQKHLSDVFTESIRLQKGKTQ